MLLIFPLLFSLIITALLVLQIKHTELDSSTPAVRRVQLLQSKLREALELSDDTASSFTSHQTSGPAAPRLDMNQQIASFDQLREKKPADAMGKNLVGKQTESDLANKSDRKLDGRNSKAGDILGDMIIERYKVAESSKENLELVMAHIENESMNTGNVRSVQMSTDTLAMRDIGRMNSVKVEGPQQKSISIKEILSEDESEKVSMQQAIKESSTRKLVERKQIERSPDKRQEDKRLQDERRVDKRVSPRARKLTTVQRESVKSVIQELAPAQNEATQSSSSTITSTANMTSSSSTSNELKPDELERIRRTKAKKEIFDDVATSETLTDKSNESVGITAEAKDKAERKQVKRSRSRSADKPTEDSSNPTT
jgi:hypothetical protein